MFSHLRPLSASERVGLWLSGLMTVVSVVVIVAAPVTGTLGLLFFGGGVALLVVEMRRRPADAAVAEVRDLARRVARHDIAGYRQLIETARPLKGQRAAAALVELSRCARLLDGLFFHARRREIGGLPECGAEPLSWALASLHPDGYVRAVAVSEMGRAPRRELVAFLVERAVERVGPVRSAALAVLRAMAADESTQTLIARAFSRVADRRYAAELAEMIGSGPGSEAVPSCCGNSCRMERPCQYVARQRQRWAAT
jgi:hypothetical protein